MPRLLLVDDNPSIHKIAESLLASSDIQLVCVASAHDALNLVTQGECFDVALLDIMMAGMDGWQLLDQLRVHPATAGIPIAMMAGVLDTVDPVRLEQASIQGFLKKPVELRDLAERVHKLLEARVDLTPPVVHESTPFSTLPHLKISELPEYHKPSSPEAVPELDIQTMPDLEAELVPEALDEDILVLVEEDLWPEVPPPPGTVTEDLSLFAEIPPEESLDLEEFDLDSLKGMIVEPTPVAAVPLEIEPVESALAPDFPSLESIHAPLPTPVPEPDFLFESPEDLPSVSTQILPEELETQELPDLGPEAEPTFDPGALAGLDVLTDEAFEPRSPLDFSPTAFKADPDFLAGLGEASITPDVAMVDWAGESEEMLGSLAPSQPMAADRSEPVIETPDGEDELDLGELEPVLEPMSEPDLEPALEPTFVMGFPLAESEPESPFESDLKVELTPEPESPVFEELLALPVAALVEQAPESATPAFAVPIQESTPLSAAPLIPSPVGTSTAAEEMLRAITADPVLMDQLTKALVAKLSDQVLREVAWEVMPEIAERLNRH